MLESVVSAAILAGILAMSIDHLPLWMKKIVNKVPMWLQCAILHFGYAGWIGGVSGHLMGAPLAIIWFAAWTWYLQPKIASEIQASQEQEGIINAIKRVFLQIKNDLVNLFTPLGETHNV